MNAEKLNWLDQLVFDLSDDALRRIEETIQKRRKREAEPVIRELALFVGQDPLDGCLHRKDRPEAIHLYRQRTGATLAEARQAFADFFADPGNHVSEDAKKRLAKSAGYLRKAIYGRA